LFIDRSILLVIANMRCRFTQQESNRESDLVTISSISSCVQLVSLRLAPPIYDNARKSFWSLEEEPYVTSRRNVFFSILCSRWQ